MSRLLTCAVQTHFPSYGCPAAEPQLLQTPGICLLGAINASKGGSTEGFGTCRVPSLRGHDAQGAGGGRTELLSWARNTGPQVGQGIGLNLISCGDDAGVENPGVSR